jgi:hypothetical protein
VISPGHSVGILVHGDNHFIVRGPEPDIETAVEMVRRWSIIQIGSAVPDHDLISTREFRENLEWAIVVPGESEMSAAVAQLLGELEDRGIVIRRR